ncbi:MAG: NAD(P)-binding protein, partial [Myxococcota bacterium]
MIGAGMGGLSAAACAARADERVLLLEQHSIVGGCTQVFRRRGYEWDVGLHYVGDVHRPNSVLRRVFDHISQGALQWATMPDVYNRIVIGERSYDYVAGVEPFKDQMKAYFPDEAAAIDRYIDLVFEVSRAGSRFFMTKALPPEMAAAFESEVAPPFHAFSDRTTLEVMRELTSNESLISVLTGHFGDISLTRDQSSFAIHAMLIRHYINGASYPVGGASRIGETTCRTIVEHGGAVATKASVEELLVHDGAIHGVRAAGRTIQASKVISAVGAVGTINLMNPEVAVATGIAEKVRNHPPALTCTSLNIGIKAGNDELGLHPANLWVHPTADFEANFASFGMNDDGPLPTNFITYPSTKDPSWNEAHPGKTTI